MSLNVSYISHAFGNIIDNNIKSLCTPLISYGSLKPEYLAIMIMTNQHQHHDCEENITVLDIIDIISQV